MDKKYSEIKGITCEVENCIYQDINGNCNAGHIKVGNPNAQKRSETKCETFECMPSCQGE
jgi:hypothetical protein